MRPPAGLLHRGLGRVEAFDWPEDRLPELRHQLETTALPFSLHAPLARPAGYPHGPEAVFYLNDDPAERRRAWAILEHALGHARAWGGEYVVTHLAWGADSTDERRALALADEAAARFAALAAASGVRVLVETGGYTGWFHTAAQYAALAATDPGLGLCIDIGHSRLVADTRGRDFFTDLAVLAPHAQAMHLWNTRGLDHYRTHHHVPLHPSQTPAEGWIDVERALDVVLARNPDCALVFEYPYDTRDAARVEEGFAWVAAIAARHGKATRQA
ncbi:MAG: TIM barrel protein [Candidatus Binatia bacterium]